MGNVLAILMVVLAMGSILSKVAAGADLAPATLSKVSVADFAPGKIAPLKCVRPGGSSNTCRVCADDFTFSFERSGSRNAYLCRNMGPGRVFLRWDGSLVGGVDKTPCGVHAFVATTAGPPPNLSEIRVYRHTSTGVNESGDFGPWPGGDAVATVVSIATHPPRGCTATGKLTVEVSP
jgi:hypothetical protein